MQRNIGFITQNTWTRNYYNVIIKYLYDVVDYFDIKCAIELRIYGGRVVREFGGKTI